MIIQTYQSKVVLNILRSGEIYRAKPNLTLRGEYAALVDMLGLKCECPVFAVVKGKRQNTGGKVSGSVRLTLDVPDKFVHFTEYEVWADFLYAYKFSKPNNYKALRPDCEEISSRRYEEILSDICHQRRPSEYRYAQVILEKINPAWMKHYQFMSKSTFFGTLWGGIKGLFTGK